MNIQYLKAISDFVFLERMMLFNRADVVLYHPGHFPELTQQMANFYEKEGFGEIRIPDIFNRQLGANEFTYHKKLLVQLGVPSQLILPISTNEGDKASDVVTNAIQQLDVHSGNILLAGKAFFCRRFLLLAALNARDTATFDVLPLVDDRGITKDTWHESEKGIERVLHEVAEISAILQNSKWDLKD